jgi:hypothetical protein
MVYRVMSPPSTTIEWPVTGRRRVGRGPSVRPRDGRADFHLYLLRHKLEVLDRHRRGG